MASTTDASNLPGRIETLTPAEDEKLRQTWAALFKIYELADGASSVPSTPVVEQTPEPASPASTRRTSLFRWRSASSATTPAPAAAAEPAAGLGSAEDRFHRELLSKYLVGEKASTLKSIISSMSKQDHPDSLLLRFLRARKWVLEDTLNMLFTVLNWRHKEMHVDDDIMFNGEGKAAEEEKSDDEKTKSIAKGWLDQQRMGKSLWHGLDKQNRPISVIRVKSHNPKAQPPESMERYIVHLIETARLFLTPPIDTVVSLPSLTYTYTYTYTPGMTSWQHPNQQVHAILI